MNTVLKSAANKFQNLKAKHPKTGQIVENITFFLILLISFAVFAPFMAFVVAFLLAVLVFAGVAKLFDNTVSFTEILLKHALLIIITFFILMWLSLQVIDIYTLNQNEFPVPNFVGLSVDKVETVSEANDLNYVISEIVYVSDLPKGSIAAQIPADGAMVKKNRTIYLTQVSLKAELVAMPKADSISFNMARNLIESSGLQVGKLTYRAGIGKNWVIEQHFNNKIINPGEKIEKGAFIELILEDGNEGKNFEEYERTRTPKILGLNFRQAVKKITDNSLNYGTVFYDETIKNYNDSAKAIVWKQQPTHLSGTYMTLGSKVNFWLTTNESKVKITEAELENFVEEPDSLKTDFFDADRTEEDTELPD